MPISKKLRLAYVAEWLLAVPVSAVPVEHSPVVAEGDSSMVIIHEKREENLESLKKILGDPVRLDHELVRRDHPGKDSDSNGDSGRSGDSSNNSSVNGDNGEDGEVTRHGGHRQDYREWESPVRVGPSIVAKNLMITGGAIAAFILVAGAAFWLYKYKTKGKASRGANFQHWKRGGAHIFRGGDTLYDEKPSLCPQSKISRMGMECKYSIPEMPFPPPPAALAPSDTSLESHQSRKPLLIRTSLLPKNQPVSSPSPICGKGTFYDGASDVDSPSFRRQEQPPLPPPTYMTDHTLLSPSQSSSISNIKPRNTTTNSRQPSYAKMYPPPPIPKSNTTPRGAPPMVSRFSWTTTAASEVPSAAKSVRSSVDSERRFRGVNSWVSQQAGRLERGERLAQLELERRQQQARDVQLGSSPGTPSSFTHHPGAPVSFLVDRTSKESADLDEPLPQERR